MTEERFFETIDSITEFFRDRNYKILSLNNKYEESNMRMPEERFFFNNDIPGSFYSINFIKDTIYLKQRDRANYIYAVIPSDVLKFFDMLDFKISPMHSSKTNQHISDWWDQ